MHDLPARLKAAAEAMALAQSDPTGVLWVAARNSTLPALALEAAAELERQQKICGVLICDTCGKLWADDEDSDQESCEPCGRFKQRMDWALPQEIEDANQKVHAELERLRAENAALKEFAEACECKD